MSMGRRFGTPNDPVIIYALRVYLYDGSRKSPKIAKMLFSNDGPGRTAWSDPATIDSNCSSNISRSHFRIAFGGIGLVWIWPFRTSLTLCTTAVPSALRPNHFPESLRIPSEVPLFEKSGLLLRPRTECARSSDDGGSLIHYAHTDIMRSSILQPPDAADKLLRIRNMHGSGSGFYYFYYGPTAGCVHRKREANLANPDF